MTPEERLAKLKQLKQLKDLQAQQSAAAAPVPEPEAAPIPEPELGVYDTIRGGLQSAQRGQLLGFGDEIVGAGRAIADYPAELLQGRNPWGADSQDFGEKYDMFRDDERKNMEQFADENPATAFGLNMAGGLASPANWVPGMQGSGVRQTVGRAGIEGAIVGAGEAEELSDIPLESVKGAGMGSAFSGVLRGAQGAGNQFAKRRIAEDLDKPIQLMDDAGGIGDFYRGFMGRMPGARKILQDQEKPFLDTAQDAANLAKTAKVEGIDALDDAAKQIKVGLNKAKAQIKNTARLDKGKVSQGRTDIMEDTVQALDDDMINFRHMAAQEAVPDDFRVTALDGVDLDDPIATSQALKKFWKDDAFQMVKQKEFSWDEGIVENVRSTFQDDPVLWNAMGEAPEMIEAMRRSFGMPDELVKQFKMGSVGEKDIAQVFDGILNAPQIKIHGDALMEMRNFFARQANKGTDKSQAYRAVSKKFDNMIEGQLDDAATTGYRDQLGRWTTHLNYRGAVNAAKKDQGKFTQDHWLSKGSKFGDFSIGEQPIQVPAMGVGSRKTNTAAAALADKAKRANQTKRLGQRERGQLNRASRQAAEATEALDVKGTKRMLQKSLDTAKSNKQSIDAKTTPGKPSGLSEWLTLKMASAPIVAATGLGGAALGGPIGGAAATALAYQGGKALARPSGQRLMAGQTNLQGNMRKLGSNERMQEIARLIRSGMSREAAMAVTGD